MDTMVLSPLTHHKAVFTTGTDQPLHQHAATAPAQNDPKPEPHTILLSAPPPSTPAGTYYETTHGKMHPIVCTERVAGAGAGAGAGEATLGTTSVLEFVNQDLRAAQFWTTANCTLIKAQGKAACIKGRQAACGKRAVQRVCVVHGARACPNLQVWGRRADVQVGNTINVGDLGLMVVGC